MQRENTVVPECYVDTNLMNVLLGRYCNHQKGCATVCKTLNTKLANQFAIGIIDKDKNEPSAVKDYVLVGDCNHFIVSKHKEQSHYLIQIKPAVESFILSAAQELHVSLSDFDLPDNLEKLKVLTKNVAAKEDQKFSKLFKKLRSSSIIQRLDNVVKYLLAQKYTSLDDEIRKLMQ